MAYKFTIKGIRKFNEERVIEKFFDAFKEIEKIEDVKIMNHNPLNDETDSYTVLTLNVSTQGVNIKHLVSKDILVELPWLASQMDVKLCYAYLNAVKKVYRGARILDEEEKGVKLTETEAKEQWQLRCKNMDGEQWNKLYDKAEGIVNFCGCKVGIVLIQESSDISVC